LCAVDQALVTYKKTAHFLKTRLTIAKEF